MRVITGAQMKRVEENSLAFDLTYARLMENAGSAAAAFIRRTFRVEGRNCMIFCGSGNNGGDGFVAARKLYENGANVVAVLAEGEPKTQEASSMLDMLIMMEVPVFDLSRDSENVLACIQQTDIVVDALYGTGFRGALRGGGKIAAGLINDAIAAIISLDVPSGVACDTSKSDPDAVKADFTVVFDCRKPVHVMPEGQKYCGTIEVVEIGIPPEAYADIESVFVSTDLEMALEAVPIRKVDSHKGDFGTLLAVCGSSRYRGAAVLAALGALRMGVGIVRVASVEAVCCAMAASVYEAVYLPLAANSAGGIDASAALPVLAGALPGATAVLFGCGVGDGEDADILLEYLVKNAKVPIIIDADGINALARNIYVLQEAVAPVVLTPHPGEMARLCGVSTQQIQENRFGTAMNFAAKHNVTVLLKGSESITALSDGRVLSNHTGNPGLAKGGSGDILAGMTASLCAQGTSPGLAASAAAYLHGLAGDRAAKRLSQCAMLPSELLRDLCEILASERR
ncbi:MAG: NAD(P)H-hydrate dehydratase [Oscillospiraceae bacterium]|nr:NAD(P)H-hydrate dehydratase [Oscillospiraceae bacterium]